MNVLPPPDPAEADDSGRVIQLQKCSLCGWNRAVLKKPEVPHGGTGN